MGLWWNVLCQQEIKRHDFILAIKKKPWPRLVMLWCWHQQTIMEHEIDVGNKFSVHTEKVAERHASTLTAELRGVYCDDFEETWLCYDSTALYLFHHNNMARKGFTTEIPATAPFDWCWDVYIARRRRSLRLLMSTSQETDIKHVWMSFGSSAQPISSHLALEKNWAATQLS